MYGEKSLLRRSPTRFFRDDDGTVTVESILWVPIFLVFFTFIVDVSNIFHGQAKAMRMAYDGNRQASLGTFSDADETQTAILSRVQRFSPNATVTTVFDTDSISSVVVMPTNDLVIVGIISKILNIDITVSTVHMRDV